MKRKIAGILLLSALILMLVGCSADSEVAQSATGDSTDTGMPEDEIVAHVNHRTEDESAPIVYFTSDISPEGLKKVYEAMGHTLEGNVAVKISTGEPKDAWPLNSPPERPAIPTISVRTLSRNLFILSTELLWNAIQLMTGHGQARLCTIRLQRIMVLPRLRMWILWTRKVLWKFRWRAALILRKIW